MDKRMYLSIDLKSFYASVECLEHGLDPMTTNLVVADAGCTEKTICLAISPSLKSCGIPGRARLFKVKQFRVSYGTAGESKVLDVPFGRMDSPISRGAGHNVWLLDRIRRGNRVYSAEPVREQAIKVCGYWRREDYRGCGSCLRIR